MDFLSRPEVVTNLSNILTIGLIAFFISFVVTPLAAKLAFALNIVDLPPKRRRDITANRRIHKKVTPKLGGFAVLISVILSILISDSIFQDANILESIGANGIFSGIIIIGILGFFDDKYELSGTQQLLFQVAAAFAIILTGTTIGQISFLGMEISFDSYQRLTPIGDYIFTFPADIITIIWVVGLINVVNWVGGMDGLNISISSIAAFTLLLFIFAAPVFQLPIAVLVAIHIGANLGLLPYNWNPAKIFPGSIGDYLNGYLLAVFAILSGTRWTATMILFGLIIIDALVVIYVRVKNHPEVLKNPLRVLSISDKNHLHHRLLGIGYTQKGVLLIEITMMTALCAMAIVFGIDATSDTGNQLIIGFTLALLFILVAFTVIYLLLKRSESRTRHTLVPSLEEENRKQAVVKVIVEDMQPKAEDDDEEEVKFVY